MGGRGSSSGGGSSVARSNDIKNEIINNAMNSKLKGVARDAREGTGNYSFKDAKAVNEKTAMNMQNVKFMEKGGNTVAHGLINGEKVFIADKTDSNIIKDLHKSYDDRMQKLYKESQTERPEIKGTTTYDKWKKNHDKNFAAWFGDRI